MSEFADDGDNRKLLDTSMENFELILLQNKDSEDVPDELFRWKFFFNFWKIFEKFQKFRKIPWNVPTLQFGKQYVCHSKKLAELSQMTPKLSPGLNNKLNYGPKMVKSR